MMSVNVHQIASISAFAHNYSQAPLKIEIRKIDTPFPMEVTLFLYNDALTAALVKAINETVAEHRQSHEPEIAA